MSDLLNGPGRLCGCPRCPRDSVLRIVRLPPTVARPAPNIQPRGIPIARRRLVDYLRSTR